VLTDLFCRPGLHRVCTGSDAFLTVIAEPRGAPCIEADEAKDFLNVQRRAVITGATVAAITASLPGASRAAPNAADPQSFDAQTVKSLARALAAAPYKAPDTHLPDSIAKLSYDEYRQIRFDPSQALWRGANLPFEAQFFHRGFLYAQKVEVFEVAEGKSRLIEYRPEMFSMGTVQRPTEKDLGFAGFRLQAPINRPDYYDEVAVFLGASYFRAVGKNLGYGLSARGLALKTADQGGEEFPIFRAFYLERPQPGTNSIVVSAVLDSPSTSGALRITLRPGEDTIMDVELVLFPRVDLDQAGIATGTSMFLFDASNRSSFDDWRPAVHDSDGLLMLTGQGEQLWRPLSNPRTLQVSSFTDGSPRGFGLMQRQRTLADYEDLEARYEKRPSLWVEPIGDWGEGTVTLVEIPSKQEINDNIVAFWRPKTPLKAKSEYGFTYRLHWCAQPPVSRDLARFGKLRTGATEKGRVFVLQAAMSDKLRAIPLDAALQGKISTSKGTITGVLVTPDPEEAAWRLSFELQPGDEKLCELRATLMQGDTPLTETWLYRWIA
jgi:glucans biosynthesis protein